MKSKCLVVVDLEIPVLDNNTNIEGTSVTVNNSQDYRNPLIVVSVLM